MTGEPSGELADLRLLPSAAAAWGISILTPRWPVWASVVLASALAAFATVVWLRRPAGPADNRGPLRTAVALAGLVATVATAVTCAHVAIAWSGPVPALAARSATVRGVVQITADPVVRESAFAHGAAGSDGAYVVVRARMTQVSVRGATVDLRTPVVLTAPTSWRRVVPGEQFSVIGRLAPTTRGDDVVAVLSVRSAPRVVGSPSLLMRAAQHLRDGLAASVQGLPVDQRALVPALVDGDVSQFPPDLQQAFRAAGMTHLSAVSGTNLSILLALVLAIGRPLRIRGNGALILGLATVVFFVILARPQPSVLRAAVMGSVVVIGSVFGFRRGGLPALAIAISMLVLIDPWLGRSAGFALSALATGGLVLLAPRLVVALSTWAPRALAIAIAVPLAAQLTTTPVIAAISASVSLVAVPANLLAEPAVGPATVLGVGLTVLAALWPAAAGVASWLPFVPAWWIAEVARVAARAPGRAIALGDGPATAGATTATPGATTAPADAVSLPIIVLVALVTVALIVVAPRFLRSRRRTVLAGLVGALVLVAPTSVILAPVAGVGSALLGWPPSDWRIVACDVGQGDALVLRAGPHAAVVVDTGPEPGPVQQCLDRLGITSVPYVLLTHFHEDHVGGLAGVLAGRTVGTVAITRSANAPPPGTAAIRLAEQRHIPVVVARLGETWQVGAVSWQTLWPEAGSVVEDGADSGGGEGSGENNASVVWRARVGDISVLMTGDVEPSAQATLRRRYGGALAVDVLKVPHHGSRHQDPGFLAAGGGRIALVSVGLGNDYGHPNPGTLALLTGDGAHVLRTDLDGSSAVAGDRAHLRAVTQRARSRAIAGVVRAVPPGPVEATHAGVAQLGGGIEPVGSSLQRADTVMVAVDAAQSPRCRSPPDTIDVGEVRVRTRGSSRTVRGWCMRGFGVMNDTGTAPAAVTLLIGPEDFIAERTVQQIRRAARAVDPQTEMVEQSAAEVGAGELGGLLAPSLFSAARVLVLEQAADASPELGAELLLYAADPLPEMQVVVLHGGGPKGRGWADKLRKLTTVRTVACDRLKPRDLPVFVNGEIRSAGGRAEPDVSTALVDAVGADLRTLASASSQLVADSDDGYVTADLVQRYFAGRAEVTSFAVADAALLGRTAESLERLRWALGSGVAPVLVTSALAASVRRLVKVQALPAGIKPNDAAPLVGVPGWKVDQLRREAREWTSGGLATAVSAVAKADADVKGAALDPDYALEQAVLTISRARRSQARR